MSEKSPGTIQCGVRYGGVGWKTLKGVEGDMAEEGKRISVRFRRSHKGHGLRDILFVSDIKNSFY